MTRHEEHDTLLPACLCGARYAQFVKVHKIPVLTCATCGIQRQHLPPTTDLGAWYAAQYFDGVYTHTREHDERVAALRWDAYKLTMDAHVLDVGCGNGAFVDVGRARGHTVVGQDLATQSASASVFVGPLEHVAFPTASFDVVTMHDVLEHWVDPVAALRECARILKEGGRFLLDFPRFHHPAGVHHWKPVEHLWMLREEDLVRLVEQAGFKVTAVTHPIPSKVLIDAERLPVKRASVLVPAGIGDAYWVLTKLPGFLRERGLPPVADVYVQDAGGPRRTQPFLETVPFVRAAGYIDTGRGNRGAFAQMWQEAYMQDGRTVYEQVLGVDYFIAYNGILRHGRSLADTDPSFGCVWDIPMHVSKEQAEMRDVMTRGGPYIVAYFVSSGMYSHWLSDFPPAKILEALRALRAQGYRIVFLGAEWDTNSVGMQLAKAEQSNDTWVNLIGQTSYAQMAGLIRGASGIVGWPSGATLLGPVWNVPSLLVWNRYFKEAFWHNACPPDRRYAALDSAGLTPERVVATMGQLIAQPDGGR